MKTFVKVIQYEIFIACQGLLCLIGVSTPILDFLFDEVFILYVNLHH